MIVRIVQGTFGHKPAGAPCPVPVSAGECCDVSKDVAERLVSIGVAVIESDKDATLPYSAKINTVSTNDKEATKEEAYEPKIDYSKMSFVDLRKTAIERGIDVKSLKSRAAIIDALEADSNELPPIVGASDPI